jgi:Ca2+-transporting ATPase
MTSRPVPIDRLLDLHDADYGLTGEEAAARRARFGSNDIIVAPPVTWVDLVRDTLRDPMIWFLVGVSALFAVLGDYTEALILAIALVPLVGMDAYLHRRTQASTKGLASRLAATATVSRNGSLITVPARDIVPGDLAEVASGEPFPADGLVVSGVGLQVDESALTGEAHPVRKQPLEYWSAALRSAEATHWVFAGTRLLTGQARLRIVNTGGRRSTARSSVRLSPGATSARRCRPLLAASSRSCWWLPSQCVPCWRRSASCRGTGRSMRS